MAPERDVPIDPSNSEPHLNQATTRRVRAALLAVSLVTFGESTSFGQEAAAPNAAARFLVLRVDPERLGEADAEALVSLLRADTAELELEVRVERAVAPTSDGFSPPQPPDVVLVASVDVSEDGAWTVVLVDPTQRRTLVRELPSGPTRNAAGVEAVASIIVSAATAFARGEDVEPSAETTPAQPASAALREPRDSKPIEQPLSPEPRYQAHLALFGSAATFASAAPVTLGAQVAFGAFRRDGLLFELLVARQLPERLDSDYGSFKVLRTTALISGGPSFALGNWDLTPTIAGGVEFLGRGQGEASPGTLPDRPETSARFLLGAGVRSRHPLGEIFAFETFLSGTFAPQPLVFTATDENVELVRPWRFGGALSIGWSARL